jgi:hypothetical protein
MTRNVLPSSLLIAACASLANADFTRNIMITGYWPPTHDMVRQFSTNPEQNPGGWAGGNWEGRGYDLYSFFPEFPDGVGQGEGDFEVDYQDTSADWERIVNEVKPAAIITFSRGNRGSNWEIESRHRMREPTQWAPDFSEPFYPSEDMPIFQSLEPGQDLYSSLPMEAIRDAVIESGYINNAYIDERGTGGNYLSEFIGLHGVWYNSLNNSPDAEWQNFASGHIHVGINTPLEDAIGATEVTLRELTRYLDTVIPAPPTLALLPLCFAFGRRR